MGDLWSVFAGATNHLFIDENGVVRFESGETRLRRLHYAVWRTAFYAERSRRMEGRCFTVHADSDAEAVYLLLRDAPERDGQ